MFVLSAVDWSAQAVVSDGFYLYVFLGRLRVSIFRQTFSSVSCDKEFAQLNLDIF